MGKIWKDLKKSPVFADLVIQVDKDYYAYCWTVVLLYNIGSLFFFHINIKKSCISEIY